MGKRRKKDRNWVSTLEAAKLCSLSHMTIIRRFDVGDIEGYRVPGSRFRRIPKKHLLEFAVKHGIPMLNFEAPEKEGKRRALVVEDERHMANLIEKVLAADGWEVRVARNGFDAGFLAGSFLPHLILLDIMLPGLDGRDACRRMREDPRLAETKILAVTALRDERSIEEIFEAGADAHLAKPFNLSDFRSKINKLFESRPKPAGAGRKVKASAKTAD